MTTNSEWLWKMGRENPGELTEWLKAEHVDGLPNGCEITHSFSERLYGVDVSDCPYCGCERIIVHDYNESYENPHDYRVEHMDEREACTEGCFEMYFAFGSVEDAVKHADMRDGGGDGEPFCEKVERWLESDAPSECRDCDDGKWRELHDQHESSRQDVDQRECKNMDGCESDSREKLEASNQQISQSDAPKSEETAENATAKDGICNFDADSREKLEAEARRIALDFAANNAEEVAIEYRVIELLDRQAAITEEETRYRWVTAAADEIAAWKSKAEKLLAQVDELQERVDRLTAERDSLARDLAESERLREQMREKLGAACGHAHDMLALVDLDGNVVDRGLA